MINKSNSRRKVTVSATVFVLLLISSCSADVSNDTKQLIINMRNSDVKWDGNFLGLMPMSFVGATLTLQNAREPIEPLLVDAILDKDRYVAAHVLLTTRLEDRFTSSASEWNGLHVQLWADGSVSYEGNDLNNRWC